jgi:hypothetical protein
MSWATCYSGSNNIHFNFPPIMDDGRNFASWQPEAVINNKIREKQRINSNWEYRQYLTNNAREIMKYNNKESCYYLGLNPHIQVDTGPSPNVPVLFQSDKDVHYNYQNSDLKNPYLTRQQLEARMVAPPIGYPVPSLNN